jgi:phytoene dehydrogenase-like protein
VLRDLGLEGRLQILRFDPTDVIRTPQGDVSFHVSVARTLEDFQSSFPAETDNLQKFFEFVLSPSPSTFSAARSKTFGNILDQFFKDERLKKVLAFPLFGNSGLPPSSLSALIGAKMFMEFLIDGGYSPVGGMQALAQSLSERFRELGGDLLLACEVRQISVKNNAVSGVVLKDGTQIVSKQVVSNADALQTFLTLLDADETSPAFRQRLTDMIPSLSFFILYLGLDDDGIGILPPGVNIWLLTNYDIAHLYREAREGASRSALMVRSMPDGRSLIAYVMTGFQTPDFWREHKGLLLDRYLADIERQFIPRISAHVVYREAATPHTLFRYTLNQRGAAYGWEATPAQLAISDFRTVSSIKGLSLCSHWATRGLGIPGVVYVGQDTAKALLRRHSARKTAIH